MIFALLIKYCDMNEGLMAQLAFKMMGIWFPISAFVAIGFEHIPANMFMIPLGLLAGADVLVLEVLYKSFLPTKCLAYQINATPFPATTMAPPKSTATPSSSAGSQCAIHGLRSVLRGSTRFRGVASRP